MPRGRNDQSLPYDCSKNNRKPIFTLAVLSDENVARGGVDEIHFRLVVKYKITEQSLQNETILIVVQWRDTWFYKQLEI